MKYIDKLIPVFKSAKNDLLLQTEEDEFVSPNPEGVMEALKEDLSNPQDFDRLMNAMMLSNMIKVKGGIKKIFVFIKNEIEEN